MYHSFSVLFSFSRKMKINYFYCKLENRHGRIHIWMSTILQHHLKNCHYNPDHHSDHILRVQYLYPGHKSHPAILPRFLRLRMYSIWSLWLKYHPNWLFYRLNLLKRPFKVSSSSVTVWYSTIQSPNGILGKEYFSSLCINDRVFYICITQIKIIQNTIIIKLQFRKNRIFGCFIFDKKLCCWQSSSYNLTDFSISIFFIKFDSC